MTQARPVTAPGLQWVQGEIEQSLKRARTLIEQFMEAPGDPLPLRQAEIELHQVRGTAAMIQCFGVATLAEEMKQALADLAQNRVRETEAAFGGLLGATLQLSDYLDALAVGQNDHVVALLPVLNELRVARGRGLLTEADLFALQVKEAELPVGVPPDAARNPRESQESARRYLPVFQKSLVAWLRDEDTRQALGRMGKVAEALGGVAATVPLYLLWRAFAATVEAILTRGLLESLELKRLFGRAGHLLKTLAEQGETAAANAAGDVPYQFLYYVNRSRSQGPRVTQLCNTLHLSHYLPSGEAVEDMRRRLRGPNTTLLNRLSEEIRADLAVVKDHIDLVVRAGSRAPGDLAETIERLDRIAHTLNMLGLTLLQKVTDKQARTLDSVRDHPAAAGDPVWLEVATALLRVEYSLDNALFRQLRQPQTPQALPEFEERVPHSRDVAESVQALLRESLVNLARLKAAVDQYVRHGDAGGLADAARLLAEVESGLRMIDQERAAGLVGELRKYLQSEGFVRVRGTQGDAERFADAVACIEYYLEARSRQEPHADRVLDDLAGYIGQIDFSAAEDLVRPAAAAPVSTPAPHKVAHEAPHEAAHEAIDPEIREVFLEEAAEVRRQLQDELPCLQRDPQDRQALTEVRRAFHTLKGSGRMVGAAAIGEFGWAVENMLNRCLDGSIAVSPAVIEAVADSVALLPELVEAFRLGAGPVEALAALVERAQRLAKGEAETAAPETTPATPAAPAPAVTEPAVIKVFRDDTRQRLRAVRDWIAGRDSAAVEYEIEPELVRALHTVRGAAAAVGAAPVAELAAALEECLNSLHAGGLMLSVEGMRLLDDAAAELDEWIGQAGAPGAQTPEVAPWLARIRAVQAKVPQAALEAQAERRLAEVFAAEALELLQKIEQTAKAWAQQPNAAFHPRALKDLFVTLHGAAMTAQCAAIGLVAEAFGARLTEFAAGACLPVENFFGRFQALIEELFQALDAWRDGRLADDGAALAAQVFALESVPVAAPAAPVDEFLAAAPVEEPAEIIEIPLVEAAAPAADEELLHIFTGEAEELLETLDRQFVAFERNPNADEPLAELARALHTLKGSARMAGVSAIGEAAHALESLLERVGHGRALREPALFARLQNAQDGLYHMLDEVKRGRMPDATAILVELEPEAPSLRAAPEPETPEVTGVEHAPEAPPESIPGAAPSPHIPVRASGFAGDDIESSPQREAWDPLLFWRPEADAVLAALRRETARVPVETLESMLNLAGEISIYRSRLEQHNSALRFQLAEIVETIARIRDQLRSLDIETEAQIAARGIVHTEAGDRYAAEFDPLEMDRYSRMQELSRLLAESVGDLASLHASMDEATSEADSLLLQQGRINTTVQQGLMGTLMVPFSRQIARLQRVVKQTAQEQGKLAEVRFEGIEAELDRNVLERMTAPLEHLLRNAVVHGIERPDERQRLGKPESGRIELRLWRDGTQLMMELADDGGGLDYDAIRRTAVERGLMPADAGLSDDEVAQFIFEPGFSTARQVTQAAGRGVGMDVVAAEVKQLGGTLDLASERGQGTRFRVRLPLTLAVSQALLVALAHELYAVPLSSIEGIARLPIEKLDDHYREDGPPLSYGGHDYRVHYLGDYLNVPPSPPAGESKTVPAILVRAGEGMGFEARRVAMVVDLLHGNREVVSKAVGPQISAVSGVTGATILPDGRVVLILDVPALVLDRARRTLATEAAGRAAPAELADERNTIMVVDDSITMRRVTERLLARNGYRVVTAKDGLDAIAQLQTEAPAVVLLDIEMPRADGFEVAAFMRNSERLREVPIVIITSRSGEKHRARARELGVERYLIKPYQEDQLMSEVREVMAGA